MTHLEYLSYIYDRDDDKAGEKATKFWSSQKPEALAREGKYKEAAELIRKQQQKEGEDLWREWIMLGAVVLAQKDNSAYENFCRNSRKRLEKDDIVTAAKVCLLGPNSGVSPADLDAWMQRVVSLKPDPGDTYFILLEGLHAYRSGQYAKAVELLTPMCKSPRFPAWSAAATAIISMACHQEGKREDSKAAFERAREAIRPSWPKRPLKGKWYDWLIAHLLLQEAEKRMADSMKTSP